MTIDDPDELGIVEIRVHGIGNKELLDALGHPVFERLNPACEVATSPHVPSHTIRIINWARSNTEFTKGFFWYIALPFTLINVVGYMRPPLGKKYSFPICGTMAGMVLTAAQIGWGVLLVETVLAYVPVNSTDKQWSLQIPLIVALVMMTIMIYRTNSITHANDIRDPGPSPVVLVLNLAAALATGLALHPHFESSYIDALSAASPWNVSYKNPLRNPTLLWVTATTAAVYAIAFILLLKPIFSRAPKTAQPEAAPEGPAGSRPCRTDPCLPGEANPGDKGTSRSEIDAQKHPHTSYGMAVLVMLGSIILLHSMGSLLSIAVGDIMWIIRAIFFSNKEVALDGQTDLSTFYEVEGYGGYQIKLLDILALYGLGIFAIVALCWVVSGGRSAKRGNPRWPIDAKERAERQRSRVVEMGKLMPRIAICSYFASALAVFASTLLFLRIDLDSLSLPSAVLSTVCHFLAYALILATAMDQLRPVTEKAKLVADVVGFWPIRNHPLAGISYRRRVVAGILLEMSRYPHRTIVLVGHSQGSVICQWLVRKRKLPVSREHLHLITCGSPLVSLYETFFPAYFTDQDFAEVPERVASWHNFWRNTDPIATPVPHACNIRIEDPDRDGVLAKHGNYWISEDQVDCVQRIGSYDKAQRRRLVDENAGKASSD
jgi:hypothetical protein